MPPLPDAPVPAPVFVRLLPLVDEPDVPLLVEPEPIAPEPAVPDEDEPRLEPGDADGEPQRALIMSHLLRAPYCHGDARSAACRSGVG